MTETLTPETVSSEFDIFTILSERPKRAFVHDEDPFQPRRKQRRLRSAGDDETIVIDLDQKFEPSMEMIELQAKIKKSRAEAMTAWKRVVERLKPNFNTLAKFQNLMSKVALLERELDDATRIAYGQFEAEKQKEAEKFFQHQETATRPLTICFKKHAVENHEVPDSRLVDLEFRRFMILLNKERTEAQKQTDANKRAVRERKLEKRRQWQHLVISSVQNEIEEDYAEGKLSTDAFRQIRQILEKLPKEPNPTATEIVSEAYVDGILPRNQFITLRQIYP